LGYFSDNRSFDNKWYLISALSQLFSSSADRIFRVDFGSYGNLFPRFYHPEILEDRAESLHYLWENYPQTIEPLLGRAPL